MCKFQKVTPAQQLGLKGKAAPSISVAPFGPLASESVMRERRAQAEQHGTKLNQKQQLPMGGWPHHQFLVAVCAVFLVDWAVCVSLADSPKKQKEADTSRLSLSPEQYILVGACRAEIGAVCCMRCSLLYAVQLLCVSLPWECQAGRGAAASCCSIARRQGGNISSGALSSTTSLPVLPKLTFALCCARAVCCCICCLQVRDFLQMTNDQIVESIPCPGTRDFVRHHLRDYTVSNTNPTAAALEEQPASSTPAAAAAEDLAQPAPCSPGKKRQKQPGHAAARKTESAGCCRMQLRRRLGARRAGNEALEHGLRRQSAGKRRNMAAQGTALGAVRLRLEASLAGSRAESGCGGPGLWGDGPCLRYLPADVHPIRMQQGTILRQGLAVTYPFLWK
jgi:hypothetical protein